LFKSKFASNLICFGANGMILKGQNKGDNIIEEEVNSFMLGVPWDASIVQAIFYL
jgi:hypothetical protein